MPDDVAVEKPRLIRAYGGVAQLVSPVCFAHQQHPVNVARVVAKESEGLFLDQFEQVLNSKA